MEYFENEIKIHKDIIKNNLEKLNKSQDINEMEIYNKDIAKEAQFIESLINIQKQLNSNKNNNKSDQIEENNGNKQNKNEKIENKLSEVNNNNNLNNSFNERKNFKSVDNKIRKKNIKSNKNIDKYRVSRNKTKNNKNKKYFR